MHIKIILNWNTPKNFEEIFSGKYFQYQETQLKLETITGIDSGAT